MAGASSFYNLKSCTNSTHVGKIKQPSRANRAAKKKAKEERRTTNLAAEEQKEPGPRPLVGGHAVAKSNIDSR